jgi:hypothetical protein
MSTFMTVCCFLSLQSEIIFFLYSSEVKKRKVEIFPTKENSSSLALGVEELRIEFPHFFAHNIF